MKNRLILLLVVSSFMVRVSAALPEPIFKAINIDTNIAIGYGIAVSDVDGDKKPDIVLADKNHVVWYRNPSWTKHVMAEKLTDLDHVCVAAEDMDGDGKAEVAVGAGWNPGDTLNSGANFFLKPPVDRTQRWTPIRLPHEPTVHRMHWIQTSSGAKGLAVAPLHGKGNKNGEGEGVRILVYRMPQDPEGEWKAELVDSSLHMTHNFHPVRWEGPAWHELLVASKEGVFHMAKSPNGWRRMRLGGNGEGETNFTGAGEIRVGQLQGGRRFLATVEPMHGHQAVVYLQPAPGSDRTLWQRKVLDDSLVDGHAVACADFLGAGQDQAVVGWRAMNQPGVKVGIRMYVPPPNGEGEWRQILIDDNRMACEDLRAADMNGDGKPDLVASGRATRNLVLYVNETQVSR